MLEDIAQFAQDLAIEAGNLIAEHRQSGTVRHNYKDQQELVTSADIAADKLIIESIKKTYPSHRILSEETYTDKSSLKDLSSPIWIIDPIDGTVNYAHGHQMVAISIAFACDGEVKFGVVHNPFMQETFHAVLGQGAFLNNQSIEVSHAKDLRKSLIATGFPYDKSTVPEIMERTQKVLMACQDIRRLGSAALDICWVASGRLDGYFESLSPWDFAAARVIALEAGATCGHFQDVPEDIPACIFDRNLLISTPEIYNDLHHLLYPAK
jgi:myo-inositol-1(or 4)-monophosphatase